MARITLNGKKYEVTKEQLIEAVKGKEPKPIKSYYILIEKKKYPIKQPVALLLKVPTIAFTSMDAYRVLDKLGIEVLESEG
jgi:hypothetical protein